MSQNPTTPTQEFFRAWRLYQTVIEHNYMAHREIVACLEEFGREHCQDAMAILDLGCGDAYSVRTALGGKLNGVRYVGIDLSGSALELAAQSFAALDWHIKLVEGDLAVTLEEIAETFDLIVAGHSLHHLDDPAKEKALAQMRKLLRDNGHVMIYDLLPRAGEGRDPYLQRILADYEAEWDSLTQEQLASIRDHVEHFDFPIELATWKQYATATGFSNCELVFRDPSEHFGMMLLKP